MHTNMHIMYIHVCLPVCYTCTYSSVDGSAFGLKAVQHSSSYSCMLLGWSLSGCAGKQGKEEERGKEWEMEGEEREKSTTHVNVHTCTNTSADVLVHVHVHTM